MRDAIFNVTSCSRRLAAHLRRHEDRRIRVIQLGTRVTIVIDQSAVGDDPCDCPIRPRRLVSPWEPIPDE